MAFTHKPSKPSLVLASFEEAVQRMTRDGPTSILEVVKEPVGIYMVSSFV